MEPNATRLPAWCERLKTAYFLLGAAAVMALICVALASNVFVSGQVFVPGIEPGAAGYVRGVGAYVMALAWLALGAFCVSGALLKVFPGRYSFFERSRNICAITFALLFFFSVFAIIVQKAP
jgi:hypothetical protein